MECERLADQEALQQVAAPSRSRSSCCSSATSSAMPSIPRSRAMPSMCRGDLRVFVITAETVHERAIDLQGVEQAVAEVSATVAQGGNVVRRIHRCERLRQFGAQFVRALKDEKTRQGGLPMSQESCKQANTRRRPSTTSLRHYAIRAPQNVKEEFHRETTSCRMLDIRHADCMRNRARGR